MNEIPFGQRIKSSRNEVLFIRFPESDEIETLPAGKPTPVVDSFIQGKYYQFVKDGRNVYMKKNDRFQQVVPEDAADDSGLLSGVTNSVYDWFTNTGRTVQKNAGFIQEGFKQSITGLGLNLSSFGLRASYAIFAGLFFGIIFWFLINSKK